MYKVEVKVQCEVKIPNVLADLEIRHDDDIIRMWEAIRWNAQISGIESVGYYEMNPRKTWFSKGRSKLYNQRKEAKLQSLQNFRQISGDNLKTEKREYAGHFRKTRKNI
jgi:hypothetical protein